jgi:methylphosphotriester-DNA--protein-cysteine methyltransferase
LPIIHATILLYRLHFHGYRSFWADSMSFLSNTTFVVFAIQPPRPEGLLVFDEETLTYCWPTGFMLVGQFFWPGGLACSLPDDPTLGKAIARHRGWQGKGEEAATMPAAVSINYAPPPAHLGHLVSSLYELRQDVATFDEIERSDRPQLRVLLSGSGHYHFANGVIDAAAPVTLIGPTSGHIHGIGTGPMHAVGAGLLPAAWAELAGSNSIALTDRAVDARTIWGEDADALFAATTAATSTEARFAGLCDFIAAHIAGPVDENPFVRIVDQWLIDSSDPQVETLIAACDVGKRQLERLCNRYYGLPPKMLARKYRALRTAAALARGDDLSSAGLDTGYYDQSHLIREVKRFAGLTPQQFARRESALHIEIATGRKAMEGQVGPLVSDA